MLDTSVNYDDLQSPKTTVLGTYFSCNKFVIYYHKMHTGRFIGGFLANSSLAIKIWYFEKLFVSFLERTPLLFSLVTTTSTTYNESHEKMQQHYNVTNKINEIQFTEFRNEP